MVDIRDTSDPAVRMFWYRRRLVAAGAVCASVVLALFAYLPLSEDAGISQRVTAVEWMIILTALAGGAGAVLYAAPWRFPGTEWSYLALLWAGLFALVSFQVSVPFTAQSRALITSTLVLVCIVSYAAHLLDGGQRRDEKSLLFGPPP